MAESAKSKVVGAILFVALAIPGVFIFLFGSIFLTAYALDPHSDKIPKPFVLLVAVAVGSLLVLIGLRKFHQWGYLLVLFSIPASLFVFSYWLNVGGLGALALAMGITTFFTLRWVRAFYERKRKVD